jgi:hypothetical protein
MYVKCKGGRKVAKELSYVATTRAAFLRMMHEIRHISTV